MKRVLLISTSTLHGRGYLDHCAEEILDFLQREIMCIGKYEITGPTQFRVRRWAMSPDEAVRYIDEAWKADADRPLRPGEICEFDRPEDCLPPKDQVD